ncbi:MAG: ABC transporter permease [Sulfolobales archaeon]
MPGLAYIIIRRALLLILALIVVVFLTAFIIGATGYDQKIWNAIIIEEARVYRDSLQKARNLTSQQINDLVANYTLQLRSIYGVDKPWTERVIPLALNVLVLRLGDVMSNDVAQVVGRQLPLTVSDAILTVLPRTILMITVAEIIVIILGLLIGPRAAFRAGSIYDRSVIAYAAVMNALPLWWLALIFLFIFGYDLGIAPTSGRGAISAINSIMSGDLSSIPTLLYYMWLPVTTIVINFLGGTAYSIRATLIRVVREDFVTVAQAKGLPEKYIYRSYILRAAAPPIATYIALSLAGSIGGFIITESVFDWPGMGTLYYAAITTGDASTIIGLTYVFTLVYVIARMILEILYIFLDPRVRY